MEISLQPVVSIIIPVYNSENYLRRCIDSMLDSADMNIEVLLINDGSKDNSGKICDEYSEKDHRVKVFHQNNRGVSAARNKGIDEANGKWLYFVDSDDWIEKDGIAGLIEITGKYPEVNLIRCFSREINGGVCTLNSAMPSKEILFTRDNFLRTNLLGGYVHSLFISKTITDRYNLRFDENLAFGEDLEFTFRCVLNCDWILVYNKAFYNYVLNDISYSHSMPLKKINYHLITASVMNAYSGNFISEPVNLKALQLLNNGLFSFFIDLSGYNNTAQINSGEIRRLLIDFMQKNNLNFKNLKVINTIMISISMLNVKLIIYAYALLRSVKRLKYLKNVL